MMTYHVQFLLLVLAGWVNRQQQDVIDYLQEENRVLRAALLHGPEQIADLPVPVAESPGAVRIGHPSAAILLSISHPIRCSTRCLANVRARISGPMIAL